MVTNHPGIIDTSCARWPNAKDLGCGFHSALSLGTRSSSRRVVAISWSNSGSMVSAMVIAGLTVRGAVQYGATPRADVSESAPAHARAREAHSGSLAARSPRTPEPTHLGGRDAP